MDVRTIEECAPRVEHEGSTRVWWLSDVRELLAETSGSHLESVGEFEVRGGSPAKFQGSRHYRFWYILSGHGRVTMGGETRPVGPGELVVIPPDVDQCLEPVTVNAPVRWLGFAVALPGAGAKEETGRSPAMQPAATQLDVRSIRDVVPDDPSGPVTTWSLVPPGELAGATEGGFLELIDEFEVDAGGEVHPHAHPTWEFYYGLFGRGRMTVSGETQVIGPGDLVLIPPDAVHSIAPVGPNTSIRCFCFAVGMAGAAAYDYSGDRTAEVPT